MPDDDVVLTPEAAAVANEIASIDTHLAEVAQQTEDAVGQGLKGGYGWRGGAHAAEDRLDRRHDDLLQRRAALVQRLRRLTGVE